MTVFRCLISLTYPCTWGPFSILYCEEVDDELLSWIIPLFQWGVSFGRRLELLFKVPLVQSLFQLFSCKTSSGVDLMSCSRESPNFIIPNKFEQLCDNCFLSKHIGHFWQIDVLCFEWWEFPRQLETMWLRGMLPFLWCIKAAGKERSQLVCLFSDRLQDEQLQVFKVHEEILGVFKMVQSLHFLSSLTWEICLTEQL